MKLPLRFRAGGKLNVVGVQKRIEYDGLFPPLVLCATRATRTISNAVLFEAIQPGLFTGTGAHAKVSPRRCASRVSAGIKPSAMTKTISNAERREIEV
jgi:hypothetical protein